ncbi:MAG: LPS export ABC transporter periplasmic protein LptC [Candidatus Gastranaerophilales bacterium]|nr:LPS export ABC transporter periplasmic protein LptC [Candidatus Gastranaerophilales bacterium]
MKKRTKFSIIFLIVFAVLGVAAFIFSARITADFKKALSGDGSLESVTIKDIVITETKDGIKYWEIYSAIGEYDSTKVNAKLTDIVGNYYQKGKVIMSFTAPTGIYSADKKKVTLTGGVRVVGEDDTEITANEASWATADDKVYAHGNVVIRKQYEIVALSNSASITTDFKKIEIYDNTELRIYKK